jgi:hypothetical protein
VSRIPFPPFSCWTRGLRLLGCMLALGSSPALAAQVFHSPNDDGLPGSGQIPSGGVQSVLLYIDGGGAISIPGRACNDGTGDEICGFDLELTALAGLSFDSFTADSGADLMVNFSAGSIRINGIDAVGPGIGPQRIGELLVNAVDGGEVELTGGETLGADLASENLATMTLVTVPEPGQLLMLLCGGGLLAGLSRARRQR